MEMGTTSKNGVLVLFNSKGLSPIMGWLNIAKNIVNANLHFVNSL